MTEEKLEDISQEISHRPPWFELKRTGGGDIDLVDYPQEHLHEQRTKEYRPGD
jgi:hypothetical protein